jgi:hypothetical protein
LKKSVQKKLIKLVERENESPETHHNRLLTSHARNSTLGEDEKHEKLGAQRREIKLLRQQVNRLQDRIHLQEAFVTMTSEDENAKFSRFFALVLEKKEEIADLFRKKPWWADTILDQIDASLRQNQNQKKGMRWSAASINLFLQLTASGIYKRLWDTDALALPSRSILKRYEIKYRTEQGTGRQAMKIIDQKYTEYCTNHHMQGQYPYTIVKFDEVYVLGGIMINPWSQEILGLSGEHINNVEAMEKWAVKAISNDWSPEPAKRIAQTLIMDLASGFEYPGPWLASRGMLSDTELYGFCAITANNFAI